MTRARSWTAFAGAAGCVYAAVFWVTRAHVGRPGALAAAALCDLSVTIPALFYWLVVRAGFASLITLAGVALTGARAAWLVVPVAMRGALPGVGWIAAPLELVVIAALLRSNSLAGRMARSEFEVFYFALLAWRRRAEVPAGYRAVSCGEASGYRMFCLMLGLVVALEGLPVHLVVQRWSPLAAWILTGLDGYAVLWAVGVARSLTLRPVLVGPELVVLRAGMLWRVEVARANIDSVKRFESGAALDLKLATMADPQWVVALREPVIAEGLYGRRRRVRRIGFSVDESGDILGA
jgi:hypothetical protein